MSDYEELLGRLHDAADSSPFWRSGDKSTPLQVSMRHAQIMALEQAWPLILEALKDKDGEIGRLRRFIDRTTQFAGCVQEIALNGAYPDRELARKAIQRFNATAQPSSSDSGLPSDGSSGTPYGREEPVRLPSKDSA